MQARFRESVRHMKITSFPQNESCDNAKSIMSVACRLCRLSATIHAAGTRLNAYGFRHGYRQTETGAESKQISMNPRLFDRSREPDSIHPGTTAPRRPKIRSTNAKKRETLGPSSPGVWTWATGIVTPQMNQRRKKMKTQARIVAWLIAICAPFMGLPSFAEDASALSADDERAYAEAHAYWQRMADVNAAVGLPPLGEEPKRGEFVGFSATQKAEAEYAATAARAAGARWQQKVEAAQPILRALNRPNAAEPADYRSKVAKQEKDRLLSVADERWAKRDEVERKLDEIADSLGVERKILIGKDRYAVLAGEMNGEPIWVVSQNQIAAASIGADELWPTNTVPWPSSSTGLGLTGTNVALGMWEVDGAVRESHYEFQGRVVQMDQSATNPIALNYHATGVAGTMAAGGILNFTAPSTGTLMRGVAYQAYVDAFDINRFNYEMADAAAGTTNEPGLRLSNHSWGLANGWQQRTFPYYQGTNLIVVTNGWIWNGFRSYYYIEDPKFGMYLADQPDGYGCAQLDAFLATNATRHLLVYAAGNDRFSGPGQATNYYVIEGSGLYIYSNPGPNERDWTSGDGNTYGFDTMAAPGTAKNVLTVGSVLDVFHAVGAQTNWGYATNSTVTVSSFSACGPTDDGRIKPDVVAVGQANPAARSFPLVTPSSTSDSAAQGQAGTSFAAPGATAGLALPLQRRGQLFTNLTSEADAFRGSTLKALAIHAADDVWNIGPDYLTGWGVFNAVSAVRQIELDATDGRGTHIKEIELSVGETNSWPVVLDGSPFKVTAVWNDLPGTPSTNVLIDDPTPMLVNNIDIWVETEDGAQTFLPWVLNPDLTNKSEAARATAATTGYDNRNNVEQVALSAPAAGTYRIRIAHAGGLAGGPTPTNQWVSILTSGDTPLPPKVTHIERSLSTNQFLVEFECDPGAYLHLETTTNLLPEGTWEPAGTLVTESWSNAVLPEYDVDVRFWRLRRETGE